MNKNNEPIILKQINAHWCGIETKWAVPIIWEILSYNRTIRMKDPRRAKGFRLEEITASFLNKQGIVKFPFGLLEYVCESLTKSGHKVEIKYLKINQLPIVEPKISGITWEKYQKRILDSLTNSKQGIIVVPTAGGKTVLAGGIIAKYNHPVSLFTTINKSILKQTYADFCKWFPDYDIGMVGDSQCDIGHITVALYQSLGKWDLSNYNKILELVLLDEVHAASNSLTKIMKQFPNVHYRYGLTATTQKETNDKEKFFQMVSNVGPIIEKIEDDECSERVTDVDVYMVSFLNTKPTGSTYHQSFKNDVTLSQERNKKLLLAGKQLLLDNDLTALFMVDEISQARQVFYLAMEMGLEPRLAHGKTKGDTNEEIKKLLNDKKVKLVIATQVMGTGTNLPTLNGVILGSARKSEIRIMQMIGRGRRKVDGKDKTIIIDSFDTVLGDKKFYKYFKQYSQQRKEMYEEKGWYRGKLKI